jgi:hypothetical protein
MTEKFEYILKDDKFKSLGISSSLLIGDYKDTADFITCPICFNILFEPIECKGCSIAMCKKCISKWLENNNSVCPNKCKSFTESPIDRLAAKLLSKVKLMCYNNNEFCSQIISYDNFLDHYYSCIFNLVICKHCSKECYLRNFSKHLEECQEKKIPCESCGKNIKRSELNTHNNDYHAEKNIECVHCKTKIQESLMDLHLNVCDEFIFFQKKTSMVNMSEEDIRLENEVLIKQLQETKSNVKDLKEQVRLLSFRNETLQNEIRDLKDVKSKLAILHSKNYDFF